MISLVRDWGRILIGTIVFLLACCGEFPTASFELFKTALWLICLLKMHHYLMRYHQSNRKENVKVGNYRASCAKKELC